MDFLPKNHKMLFWFFFVALNFVCALSEKSCKQFGPKFKCKSIKDCPSYIPMIHGSKEEKLFLMNHQCGFEGLMSMVCCPSVSIVSRSRCVYTAVPDLHPNSKCCGVDGKPEYDDIDDRVSNGAPTNIYQYTWLTLLEHKNKGKEVVISGSGSIISNRYVLTAAHCILNKEFGEPSSVRIGEYNTETAEDYDIMMKRKYTAKSIAIERNIVHPEFSIVDNIYKNDIALVRLSSTIKYNDLIRPICLPSINITHQRPTKDLVLAGWGSERNLWKNSPTKQHVRIPLRDISVCESALDRKFWKRQICAGGQEGKGDCKGDSGGPLMHHTGEKYEIVGIVSFSFKMCGIRPSVYTNVIEYVPWIMKNIVY